MGIDKAGIPRDGAVERRLARATHSRRRRDSHPRAGITDAIILQGEGGGPFRLPRIPLIPRDMEAGMSCLRARVISTAPPRASRITLSRWACIRSLKKHLGAPRGINGRVLSRAGWPRKRERERERAMDPAMIAGMRHRAAQTYKRRGEYKVCLPVSLFIRFSFRLDYDRQSDCDVSQPRRCLDHPEATATRFIRACPRHGRRFFSCKVGRV